MPIDDGMSALKNAQRLIEFADKSNITVYHVQHVAPTGSAMFALDSEGVKFHPLMQPRAHDVVVQKSNVSAVRGLSGRTLQGHGPATLRQIQRTLIGQINLSLPTNCLVILECAASDMNNGNSSHSYLRFTHVFPLQTSVLHWPVAVSLVQLRGVGRSCRRCGSSVASARLYWR
ncbi:isochorismatase family protein [Pseudomonas sp.]|uniref:isochorismatase family protein n=1 Tax=Pseudomonas sp. TaxID=306 RepID=UPI0039C928B3